MTEIKIYKCEICGKESRVYKTLLKHETECIRKKEKELQHIEQLKIRNNEFLLNFDPSKLDEQINDFLEKANGDHFEVLGWRINYFDSVSNSHCCPIKGVTNFRRANDLPKGYPGFQGVIAGKRSKYGYTISDYINHNRVGVMIPGLHTGTGGGGQDEWSYDFKFFLEDFPNFKKEFEEKIKRGNIKSLLNNGSTTYNFKYSKEPKEVISRIW